jgi:hypothetical protein
MEDAERMRRIYERLADGLLLDEADFEGVEPE